MTARCYPWQIRAVSIFTSTSPTYRRVMEIARGGMGRVDLVVRKQEHFERLHALKRLRSDFLEDDEVRRMFVDEARIAGLIRHPNVVSVTDVGEDSEGPFLVMDYIDGVALSVLLKKLIQNKRSLPMTVALTLVAQVADGLHAAHSLRDSKGSALGVIHRDVSPQNVLVGFDGFARVTDFGIAKAVGPRKRVPVS